MDATELRRYDRQVQLAELGLAGQLKLKQASVLIIGAGGLGSPIALYLTAAGIGHIGIVDDDTVEESNLQRQILFNIHDLGKKKAEAAVEKLKLLNPFVSLNAYSFRLNKENAADLIAQYDIVMDGSDNFPTRYLVNDTCLSLNKPLVFGSIFNFEGQVAVFNFEGSPDYRVLYPEAPPENEVPNCGDNGVIGTLPGIIGTYMANELIKIVCNIGETLAGKVLLFNALNNSSTILKFNTSEIKKEPVYQNIDLDYFLRIKDDPTFYMIDVREAYEYEESNLGGINIPLYELPAQLNSIKRDKNLILCCSTGHRSKIAYNLLKENTNKEIFILALI